MQNSLLVIRKKKNLTRLQLAVYASVSPTVITEIELRGYSPLLDTKAKLAAALGCRISDIWADEKLPACLIEASPREQKKLQGAAA